MKLKCYQWKATDRFLQRQKGKIIAENAELARQNLLTRGFQQIQLQRNWQFPFPPKSKEISGFLTQLAILLQSSVQLKDSLQIILKNCRHILLNQWIRELLKHIESGFSFSQALERTPKLLNYQERQLIKIGEISGNLAEVCVQLATAKQQQLKLQQKLQKILLYPLMVLAISVILTVLLLLFVVPQFAQMYENNRAELPFFTLILLNLSALLSAYFWQGLMLLLGMLYLLKRRLKQSLKLQQIQAAIMAKMPVLSEIVQLSRLVGFCQNLHLMLQSGIPLNQALHSFLPQQSWQNSPELQTDVVLNAQIELIINNIQQGRQLSDSVSTTLFPEEAQQMLQIGETSGRLAEMLGYISDNYRQQLDHNIDLLSQMLEPLLMLIIGMIIGFIMLGMYMPIFNMGSVIQ